MFLSKLGARVPRTLQMITTGDSILSSFHTGSVEYGNSTREDDQSYPLVNIQKAIEHGPVEIVDLP